MKTFLSILMALLFTLWGSAAYGQSNKFELGIEGGTTFASLYGNPFLDSLHRTSRSGVGGLFVQYHLNECFSLRTHVAYERKGSTIPNFVLDPIRNPGSEATMRIAIDYLTLPLLLRATFGKKIPFYVNAGPYIGYLMGQSISVEVTGEGNTSIGGPSLPFRQLDAGITSGLGFSVPIQPQISLSFELRNNIGLLNIGDAPVTPAISDGNIKTNSTTLLAGIAYRFGEE